MKLDFCIASYNSLMIYFGEKIDPLIAKEVQKAYLALKDANIKGFLEIIPSYASVMITYDILEYSYEEVCKTARLLIENAKEIDVKHQKIVTIPTYYGLEVGLDLEILAEEKKLSVEEIIALHVKESYFVYAIGFAPGFAYLGEIDAALCTARLSSPRKAVPKGSVAIADRQTAVYPALSPGGWKILGRTPTAMFDSAYEGLSLLHVGDLVRFEAITKEVFLKLGGVL
ncbi:MAG: 5-oxoprolinase subunit PxpB [Campylobacteraceae bacterium]|nr:5-oxoprolinase subunit PxpB [Campylobacteraceae bacterium]